MNRTAIVTAVLTCFATAGVCYVAFDPGGASQVTVDGSSESAFKTSLDAVKQSLPKDQHDEFEEAMAMLAKAAVMNGLGDLAALSADADAPARRLRGHLDGMTGEAVLAAAKQILPGIEAARLNANESAAIATMKNIASAQAQLQASGIIDRNGNGAGEYGWFGEMAGVSAIVGADGKTIRVQPPVLSSAFGNVQGGQVTRSGYVFQMYLPGQERSFQVEAPVGGMRPGTVSADLSEVLWCCYAWPNNRGSSGNRVFFVNQAGDVLSCRNSTAHYSGTSNQPSPLAAFLGTQKDMGGMVAANTVGNDGERWLVVN